jgi:hypothetical protein
MNRERRTIQSPKSDGDRTEEVMRDLPDVPSSCGTPISRVLSSTRGNDVPTAGAPLSQTIVALRGRGREKLCPLGIRCVVAVGASIGVEWWVGNRGVRATDRLYHGAPSSPPPIGPAALKEHRDA